MERRALIALALSFVVFMAFMYYGEMTKRPAATPAVSQQAPAAPAPAPSKTATPGTPATPAPAKAASTRPAKDVVVDTPSFKAVFTELGVGSRASS